MSGDYYSFTGQVKIVVGVMNNDNGLWECAKKLVGSNEAELRVEAVKFARGERDKNKKVIVTLCEQLRHELGGIFTRYDFGWKGPFIIWENGEWKNDGVRFHYIQGEE